ncbi:hypothetical protein Plhal304r1_c086g0169261 [Plasmopara halstedii]
MGRVVLEQADAQLVEKDLFVSTMDIHKRTQTARYQSGIVRSGSPNAVSNLGSSSGAE